MPAGADPRERAAASWDLLHEEAGPRGAWTRVNVSEAIPGVPTPLTWSFWFPVQELGILGAWNDLGLAPRSEVRIASRTDDRLGAIFYGRPAANLDLMRRMADRIPGSSGDALEHQLLGRRRSGPLCAPARARHPAIALKLPWAVWRLPARLERLRAELDPWWKRSTDPGASIDDPSLVRDLRASHDAFLRVMRPHAAASNIAQLCYEQVRRLAEDARRPGLEVALVSGYSGLEETAELRLLWDVARGRCPLEAYLVEYGFHAPSEGELSSRSWREDASPLQVALRGMRKRGEEESPLDTERRQSSRRAEAERELLAALPVGRRRRARIALAAARRYVPQREQGKATFLRVLDVARRAARARGRIWTERGLIADADDVFYLSLDELTGSAPPRDAEARIRFRRERRAVYQGLELPQAWVGMPRPRALAANPVARDRRIEALGVSPGVVEGSVRVVDDLDAEPLFEPGEVLVCPRTDPSWASLLWLAGAAVIDVGGPLSHGAIVARELGIPCVINAGDATRRLRTGDRVRVDGSAGTVEVLGSAPFR